MRDFIKKIKNKKEESIQMNPSLYFSSKAFALKFSKEQKKAFSVGVVLTAVFFLILVTIVNTLFDETGLDKFTIGWNSEKVKIDEVSFPNLHNLKNTPKPPSDFDDVDLSEFWEVWRILETKHISNPDEKEKTSN